MWVFSLGCEVAKVWVLEHLGTARASLYCFRGVFCAREASLWVSALLAIFVFLGDLSMSAMFLCYLGWGAMCDPYMPVHVL